jgi:hypothetical protein
MNCLRDFAMIPPEGIVAAIGGSFATRLLWSECDQECSNQGGKNRVPIVA